jgi:hypothetical protein
MFDGGRKEEKQLQKKNDTINKLGPFKRTCMIAHENYALFAVLA